MPDNHHVDVDAKTGSWNSGIGLEPNTAWVIIPSSDSRYTLNGGTTYDNFHGSSDMDGGQLHIPAIVRLGGLAVLVWHHQPGGGAVPEIISFPPGKPFASTSVGPQGGSMFFIICDLPGAYGDNSGTCGVDINPTDAGHLLVFQSLCDSYQKLNSVQFAQAAAKCGLHIAVGAAAGAGTGGGLPGAAIWGTAAAVTSDACADVAHQVVTATQECLNESHDHEGNDDDHEGDEDHDHEGDEDHEGGDHGE
jgi:hypothetical protein